MQAIFIYITAAAVATAVLTVVHCQNVGLQGRQPIHSPVVPHLQQPVVPPTAMLYPAFEGLGHNIRSGDTRYEDDYLRRQYGFRDFVKSPGEEEEEEEGEEQEQEQDQEDEQQQQEEEQASAEEEEEEEEEEQEQDEEDHKPSEKEENESEEVEHTNQYKKIYVGTGIIAYGTPQTGGIRYAVVVPNILTSSIPVRSSGPPLSSPVLLAAVAFHDRRLPLVSSPPQPLPLQAFQRPLTNGQWLQ